MMVPVSPRHSVLLAPEYAQLIRSAPEHDFVMRTITRREANGLPLMSAEMVIAGKDTRGQFPLAAEYPMHFRKTYFPGRLRGEPSAEFENQQRASEILGAPPPIGWTKDSFRSCFVPGKPYSRLTPFGIEPVENNVSVAEEIDPAKALGGKAHHGLDLGWPAHVCAVVGHLHVQRLYLRLCSGHIAKAVEHQIGALGRQGLGKAQADTAGRSGHECCFAFKHEILLCNWGDNSHLRRAGPLVQP